MSPLSLLVLEIIVSLALSLAITWYERDVIEVLLDAHCPPGGSRFWLKMLGMLQTLGPLLLVVWHAPSGWESNPVAEFKGALTWMLLGHCLALVLVSRNVWRALVVPGLKAGVPALKVGE